MHYTFRSLRYVFKNFRYIFPFSILPAIFLALALDTEAVQTFIGAYADRIPSSLTFPVIFRAVSIFGFRSVGSFFLGIIGIAAMVICSSLLMALIEKHMRIGKKTFNGIFSKLNDNFLSNLLVCVLLVFFYELWSLIVSAVLFAVSRIGAIPVVYVLSAAAYLALQFVLCLIVSTFYLWLPCVQITGFKTFEAFSYSYQLVSPVMARIAAGQFLSLTISDVVIGAIALLISHPIGLMIAAVATYALMTLVFCVRMQVAYFDRAQIERADLKKYYFV